MKIPITVIRKLEDVPNFLCIKDGRLICVDGSEPDFSDQPDGPVNLFDRDAIIGLLEDKIALLKLRKKLNEIGWIYE